jgi:hypothetical protein
MVNDLAALRRDFAALLSYMNSSALKGGNDAAEDTPAALGDRARRLYDSVAAQGERSAKAIGHQVEEHPIRSLLIAFGRGLHRQPFAGSLNVANING